MSDISNYSGVNDKPGMYFNYWFSRVAGGHIFEVCFYSFSEEDARKQYFETYNEEAGTLIRRENW